MRKGNDDSISPLSILFNAARGDKVRDDHDLLENAPRQTRSSAPSPLTTSLTPPPPLLLNRQLLLLP